MEGSGILPLVLLLLSLWAKACNYVRRNMSFRIDTRNQCELCYSESKTNK